jgi:hypothetical protein
VFEINEWCISLRNLITFIEVYYAYRRVSIYKIRRSYIIRILDGRHLLLLVIVIDEVDKATQSMDSGFVEVDGMEEYTSVGAKWTTATPLHFTPLEIWKSEYIPELYD